MTKKNCVLILAAAIVFAAAIIALVLRLPQIARRPMHGDEAIHAVKFGELLEQGVYIYDPNEYHGPTLNYLTLIPAWLSSAEKLTDVDEFTLRVVPVVCGIILVLLVLLIADGLGPAAVVCAALLTAISPAMVFYSRYYIQEMLLVCFTFGAIVSGYRYARGRNILWALAAGIFAGLMHATKETCIIAFGSMILALMAVLLMQHCRREVSNTRKPLKLSHIFAGLGAALFVSALFYSSFLTNPRGILDSFTTYTTYFNRAGNNDLHIHPWHYYLRMLIYYRYGGGPVWTEVLIVGLAMVGFAAAVVKKGTAFANAGLLRFVAFYTLIMTVVYSVVPYKTPWCMLSFLQGMILLAGLGAVVLIRLMPILPARIVVILLLFAATVHLTWLSYLNNYKYYADSRNPYVYAHPTTDVFTVVEKIGYYAAAHPEGRRMDIEVICPGHDYWPLPWYLRSFSRVHYRDRVSRNELPAPLIIASDAVENDLRERFYDESIPFEHRHLYMYLFEEPPYYVWLRPRVKLLGFVREDLWEAAGRGPDPNDLIKNAPKK
ncbi:MAG: TIGR03663 family protein [Sedimentisphaerales bacterium]|nr:TIGR03663 family protein [Sedimentisphaerales bacterium]